MASVTGLNPGSHHLRVLFRKGMWEVYADDLLVQTYIYGGSYPLPKQGYGRIGLACASPADKAAKLSTQVGGVAAHTMTL